MALSAWSGRRCKWGRLKNPTKKRVCRKPPRKGVSARPGYPLSKAETRKVVAAPSGPTVIRNGKRMCKYGRSRTTARCLRNPRAASSGVGRVRIRMPKPSAAACVNAAKALHKCGRRAKPRVRLNPASCKRAARTLRACAR